MTSDAAVEMTAADEKGRVVAEYLARKLREDVSRGTDATGCTSSSRGASMDE